MSKRPVMTTSAGNPVGDNQNSLTAGPDYGKGVAAGLCVDIKKWNSHSG